MEVVKEGTGCVFVSLLVASAVKVGVLNWIRQLAWKRLEKVGEVLALFVYPVKSCRGVSVTSAIVTDLGLESSNIRDRLFLVVRSNNKYRHIDMRTVPLMGLIVPSLHGQCMHLDAPEMPTLVLPLEVNSSPRTLIDCMIYGELFKGTDCGDQAGSWFSKYLKKDGLRLLYRGNTPECHNQRSFTDAPCSLFNTASLADLNERLAEPVAVRNFRPNIVVSGASAYDEDNWDEVIIGKVHFQRIDSCLRCIMINVDPETGLKNRSNQPLKTLLEYRLDPVEKYAVFGSLLQLISHPGKICVGDAVYVMRKT
ncbi:mitochondrial amidoxime reducing component 2-like [Tubulanus polymorphus]|uniref:mitochondrial amidoxime reducing component 2-like n=1 Tax=Tubulanus polymorphus TaxID=672921 RepID=UPI003DA2B2A4